MKLYQALDIMLRNGGPRGKEVLYKVDRLVAAAYRNKMSVRGRHVVWLIRDSFKSFDETDTTFGFEHLAKVTIQPNEKTGDLAAFLKTWDWVLNSLHGVAYQEKLIHQQFYRSIVKHQDLKFHMDCYHMRPRAIQTGVTVSSGGAWAIFCYPTQALRMPTRGICCWNNN